MTAGSPVHPASESFARASVWSLLDELDVASFLVLEQVYLREGAPVSLPLLCVRLGHLNLHRRTIARRCLALERRGLVRTIASVDLFINPVVCRAEEARRLVALWRTRERMGRGDSPRVPHDSSSATPGTACNELP